MVALIEQGAKMPWPETVRTAVRLSAIHW